MIVNNFSYDEQFYRTIPACIIDGRQGNPAVAGQVGTVIKAFTDSEVHKARQPGVYTYKMETLMGNLVGSMTLQIVNGQAGLYQLWLRQAFQANSPEIIEEINIFIQGLDWIYDNLI